MKRIILAGAGIIGLVLFARHAAEIGRAHV